MKEYGKIREDGSIQKQGNPVVVNIANPNEEQKRMCATLRGELELKYTKQPEYNPETQYLIEYWEQEGEYAVEHYEVKEIPQPEPEMAENEGI